MLLFPIYNGLILLPAHPARHKKECKTP
jgi:hypothetical protein